MSTEQTNQSPTPSTPDVASESTPAAAPASTPVVDTTVATKKIHPVRRAMGGYGALLTLIGWITMILNPWLSGGCALAGLILSIIGTCIPRSARRNLAITSIVASSVLILVLSIFLIGLHFI